MSKVGIILLFLSLVSSCVPTGSSGSKPLTFTLKTIGSPGTTTTLEVTVTLLNPNVTVTAVSGAPQQVQLDFNQDVAALNTSQITLNNIQVTNIQKQTSRRYLVTWNALTSGAATITLLKDKVVGVALQKLVNDLVMSWTADLTPPKAVNFSVASKTYTDTFNLTLTAETGDVIRYTLNDATPLSCTEGTVYSAPVKIDKQTVRVSAVACDPVKNLGPVASVNYTYVGTAPAAPTIAPTSQYFSSPLSVTLTKQNNLHEVRYVLSATAALNCTTGGTVYSSAIVLPTQTTTIRAISCYSGLASTEVTATYTYDNTKPMVTVGPLETLSYVYAPFIIKAVFSEDVSDRMLSHFEVTNGVASLLTSSNKKETQITISPTKEGSVKVRFIEGKVMDLAQNTNLTSNTYSVDYLPAKKGEALYTQNCLNCHGMNIPKAKQTAAIILAAVQNIPSMVQLKPIIGSAESQLIAAYLASIVSTPTPTPPPTNPPPGSPTPPPTGGTAMNGAMLFSQYCQVCHGDIATTSVRDHTPVQIQTALLNVTSMRDWFKNTNPKTFTSEEVTAISLALSPTSQSCPAPTARNPGKSIMGRLSRREIINVVNTLADNNFSSELTIPFEGFPYDYRDKTFDTNSWSLSLDHVNAMFDIAELTATVFASRDNAINNFGGNCLFSQGQSNACIDSFTMRLSKRLLRRPLDYPVAFGEVVKVRNIYLNGGGSTDFKKGIMAVTKYFLSHPEFLYKMEYKGNLISAGLLDLDVYERAARISFTLTGNIPDNDLIAAADNGSLSSDAGILTQVRRLMGTTAFQNQIKVFAQYWLNLDKLATFGERFMDSYYSTLSHVIDGTNDPNKVDGSAIILFNWRNGFWENRTDSALGRDAYFFVMDKVINDKKFYNLMTDTDAYLPGSYGDWVMKTIYDIQDVTPSPPWGRVQLASNRKGILTRAFFLFNSVEQTNPILRGVYVLRKFLCAGKFKTPPNLKPEDLAQPVQPTGSRIATRTLYDQKVAGSACISCHQHINPIGNIFEGYDSLARYRACPPTTPLGKTVNCPGPLVERFHRNGYFLAATSEMSAPGASLPDAPVMTGADAFGEYLATNETALFCHSTAWTEFFMQRPLHDADTCFNKEMSSNLGKMTYKQYIEKIFTSIEFKRRQQ